jgi:hypothetical protein
MARFKTIELRESINVWGEVANTMVSIEAGGWKAKGLSMESCDGPLGPAVRLTDNKGRVHFVNGCDIKGYVLIDEAKEAEEYACQIEAAVCAPMNANPAQPDPAIEAALQSPAAVALMGKVVAKKPGRPVKK